MISAALADERGWKLASVLDWLFSEGRLIVDPNELTRATGERLTQAGAPVVRLRLVIRLLHPLLTAWSAIWEANGGLQPDVVEPHGLERRSIYVGSPMDHLARTGAAFRRKLEAGLSDCDHQLLHELAAQGATDYLALPLAFTTGQFAAMVVVTDRPGGLDRSDVAKFEALAAALGPVLETIAAHRLARVIATAYIGPRAGARVLEGRIKRGDVEVVRAAIWFSDVRGWSRLSLELPPEQAVALANGYFETVEAAIREAGGEVLKLIGDAVLAIFPAEQGDAPACRAAIEAAQAAQQAAAAKADGLEFGVGLNLGEVIYGNVGAPSRLDFTAMGEAVNLTARIERLCRKLAQPIVVSEPLARASGVGSVDLGEHALVGWDAPVQVYAPAPHGAGSSASKP